MSNSVKKYGYSFLHFLHGNIPFFQRQYKKKQRQTTKRNLPVAFELEAMILRPERFPNIIACEKGTQNPNLD